MPSGNRDMLQATSKHRSTGHVEWSRQTSRATPVFFIPQPTPSIRGLIGAEPPAAHTATYDMERSAPRPLPPPPDARDYNPVHYEELHKPCPVSIGRCAPRIAMFGTATHQAETVVDSFKVPGWIKKGSKRGTFAAAERDSSMAAKRWDTGRDESFVVMQRSTPSPVFSAYKIDDTKPLAALAAEDVLRPVIPGGSIPKAKERTLLTEDIKLSLERPPLQVNYESVQRNQVTVRLEKFSERGPAEKPSDKYRRIFRTPPPAPMTTHEPRRTTGGYAVQRFNPRVGTVGDILALAEADAKRARSVMSGNFGARSRSPSRSALMYSTSGTPTSSMGEEGRGGGSRLRPAHHTPHSP